jgi:uncharacterized protein YndB with AHSA1/START domain
MGETQLIAEPGIPQVQMIREFDAPRELLFRAYTEPELLKQWLGPRRLDMEVDQLDVRHGGEWRYIHSDADGRYAFRGVFHGTPSVEGGIVQTWEYEGAPGHVHLEVATFEERDGGSRLVLNAVYPSVESRDAEFAAGMESGAREALERLDELVAKLEPVS